MNSRREGEGSGGGSSRWVDGYYSILSKNTEELLWAYADRAQAYDADSIGSFGYTYFSYFPPSQVKEHQTLNLQCD
jgi:hypothetical protein